MQDADQHDRYRLAEVQRLRGGIQDRLGIAQVRV